MGYFDGLVEGSFKTSVDGKHLFYPWGVLGKGYILADPQTEQRLRRFLKLYYMISLPLVILLVITVGYIYTSVAALVAMSAYGVGVHRMTRTLPATRERLTLAESYANSAKAQSPVMLLILFVFSILFVIAGIWVIVERQQIGVGLSGVLFFGACAIAIGFMLRSRS